MAGFCQIEPDIIEDIILGVDEACSNVIRYAYAGNTKKAIRLSFEATNEAFRVSIEDNGTKANPDCLIGKGFAAADDGPACCAACVIDKLKPGGLGIHLMKRAFDSIDFDRTKKRGNRLVMIRYAKRT